MPPWTGCPMFADCGVRGLKMTGEVLQTFSLHLLASPHLVIPSAVEGSALRLSPSTNFYRAPASDGQRNVGLDSNRFAARSDFPAVPAERTVPLRVRCWS